MLVPKPLRDNVFYFLTHLRLFLSVFCVFVSFKISCVSNITHMHDCIRFNLATLDSWRCCPFLVACTQLYNPLCPFVRRLVGRSRVRQSAGAREHCSKAASCLVGSRAKKSIGKTRPTPISLVRDLQIDIE